MKTMRFIDSTWHAALDYVFGALMIGSPWLYLFADVPEAKWVAVACGVVGTGMAFITDYEAGFLKIIPYKVHLAVDVLSGLVLIAAPWVIGFTRTLVPMLIIGVLEIAIVVFSQRSAYKESMFVFGPSFGPRLR